MKDIMEQTLQHHNDHTVSKINWHTYCNTANNTCIKTKQAQISSDCASKKATNFEVALNRSAPYYS